MSQTIEVYIRKKFAIYLPKTVVKALGLKEGDKMLLSISDNTLIMEKLQDPIELAIHGKKFASIAPKDVEAISLEEQKRGAKNTS